MKKIIYLIFFTAIIVGIVSFVEIQRLMGTDFEFLKIVSLLKRGPYAFDISRVSIKSAEGRNAIRKSNIMQIAFAVNKHKKDVGDFPNINKVSGSLTKTGIFSENEKLNPIVNEYLDFPLKDPKNNSEYHYSYIYRNKNYILFARLETLGSDRFNRQYYCVDSFGDKPKIISHNPSSGERCEKNL